MSNWKSYINGNYTVQINLNDGTKIRETEDDEFNASFAENIDIKICDYCDIGCKWCHEDSTVNGKFGDVLNEAFLATLHPYQEVAIGGGDATAHPDLIPFLEALKARNVIANLTVNQIHFMKKRELIEKLISEKLIYGLGVSLMNPTPEFIEAVSKYPNVVIHTINGTLTQDDIEALQNKNLKILILGYKHLRRGNEFYEVANRTVNRNQDWLKENLKYIVKKFKVVSFDNKAIEQLDVQRLMSPEKWETFFMGDEGTSTFYIDMVNRKFAQNSTAPLDERFDLLNSVDEMFNVVRNILSDEEYSKIGC